MRTLDEVVEVVSTMFDVKIREEEEGTGGNYRYSEKTTEFQSLFGNPNKYQSYLQVDVGCWVEWATGITYKSSLTH